MHLIAERIMLDSNYICGQGNLWTDNSIQYDLSTIIVPEATLYSTHPHGCCRRATGSTSTYKNLQLYFKNRSLMCRTDRNFSLNCLYWLLDCLVVLCDFHCRFYNFNYIIVLNITITVFQNNYQIQFNYYLTS